MRRALLSLLAITSVAASCLVTLSPCRAQRSRVEADPNKEYLVTPEIGAWMVLAANYTGPEARDLARQMVHQLRSREGLPTFMFLYVNEDQKRRAEERERRRQMFPQDNIAPLRVNEHWGVLIGGYGSPDEARRALNEIKKVRPPELKLASGADTTDTVINAVPRPDKKGYEIQKAPINPLANGFVVRNPTAKNDAPAKDTAKEDQFMKNLNQGRPYSVYDNKKPWTLVVKDFGGASVVKPRSASGAFFNLFTLGKLADILDASGKQAEEVARVLRETPSLKEKVGMEAYVLHRRYDSLVTVGGFDGPDDPALLWMQNHLRKMKLGWMEFYANPAPMPVPGK